MARDFSAQEFASLVDEFAVEVHQDAVTRQWSARSFDGPRFHAATREEACRKVVADALANEADWRTHVDDETARYLELTDD